MTVRVEDVPERHRVRFTGHDFHSHDEPLLIWVLAGRGRVRALGEEYVLPAGTGLWLAAGVPHDMSWDVRGVTAGFLLAPGAEPDGGCLLVADPALAEAVAAALAAAPGSEEERAPLRAMLTEVLREVAGAPLPLPLPSHEVAGAIAGELLAGDGDTLELLSRRHHISPRQVQRLFLEETGLTFSRWRTRARLNLALTELRAGRSMGQAARRAGYRSRHGLAKALRREGR
ncbi:helix-turn-helix transcriptional regulator [Amycolatopsis suaedae]|uniref:helix-turn-helix transcriptional regulator n=1 Tax=Amycolatopsis suaedae TaxID=2510978 RepID=UPI0013EF2765|nr:AraC family transcriptional regulator [Amycolatopsis suaedae]